MACYNIKDKNGRVQNTQPLTERDVDMLLSQFQDKIAEGIEIEDPMKIFDLDPQQITLDKLNKIYEQIKSIKLTIAHISGEDSDSVKLHDHPDYVGVTTFMETRGNPKTGRENYIVKPFDKQAVRIQRYKQFVEKTKDENKSAAMVDELINETYPLYSEYGDDFHSIMESVFKNTKTPTMKHLNEDQVKEFRKMAEEFKQSLIEKYGPKAKFFAEFSLRANKIDPDIATILNEKDGKKYISGTIDLLVVDEQGFAHIYDFKTSAKSNSDWDINKKDHIQNQLIAYSCILEQYGIKTLDFHVIPIKEDFIYTNEFKTKIVGLSSFKIDEEITKLEGSKPETSTLKNWRSIFPMDFTFTSESLKENNAKVQHMLPVEPMRSIRTERTTKEVSEYIDQCKPVRSDSKMYGHAKWVFIKRGLGKEERVYFNDDESRDNYIKDYVEELKNARARELDTIATNIGRVMGGELKLSELADTFSEKTKTFMIAHFQRYIDGQWEFVRNKEMNAYGIFIFKKDKRSEIVVLSNQSLGAAFKLPMGTTVLGKTREDQYLDSKKILAATTGNFELMRAMIYVADNQELFKDNKITQVKVLNPWQRKQATAPNSILVNNYNLLAQDNSSTYEGNIRYISSDIFYGDLTSTLSIANDLLELESEVGLKDFTLDGLEQEDGTYSQYTIEWLKDRITWLRREYELYSLEETNANVAIRTAYKYLNDALQAMYGFHTIQEYDKKSWIAGGTTPGVLVASTSYSPSANIRQFDDLMAQYATEVRQNVEKTGRRLAEDLLEFYKSKGDVKFLGGEARYFKEWFVTDAEGKITKDFILKDPNSRDFDGSEASRKALDTWLKTMAKLRWPHATEEELEIKKGDGTGEYYQVPLTEARFSRQAKELGRFGVFKALKNKFEQYSELTQEVFAGKYKQLQEYNEDVIRNNWSKGVFNKLALNQDQRRQMIEDKGVGFFETDLEAVIALALPSYIKSEVSKKYIPVLSAMQISLKIGESLGEQKQQAVEHALDKLIRTKFWGENYLESDNSGLLTVARWLNVMKKGLSALALGFNPRSFVREFLQGTWMGISRAKLSNFPGINEKTYKDAYEYVLLHAHENFSSVSKLQQLDARYGIANYSLTNISRKRKLNWFGIRNMSSDTLFWGSTSPDFQHRVTMVVAKMMGDGVWEAYEMNEDNDLVYNWKKDKRFSIYAEGKTDDPKYLEQKTLYLRYIEELNAANMKFVDKNGTERNYKEGDDLPEAYLPKEIQAMKNYSDLLYGHYDDESRSLINDMFLGAFFMQYKTYIVSRIEQWTMSPGTYNTEFLQWEVDPISGKHLYKVHKKELSDGIRPEIEILAEDKIENFEELMRLQKEHPEEQIIEPLYVWKGIPMEGIARSYFNFLKKVKSLDWNSVKELMKNPVERDNLLLGLHDCAWASLMILIITALFGLWIDGEWTTDTKAVARHARAAGWGKSFAFNVLYGSYTDFPIWSSIQSMMGDWNPPAWTSAKRLVTNTGAVILGNKTLFQAVTNTVGAAADLKGIADALSE